MKFLDLQALWIAAPAIILLYIILKKRFLRTNEKYADEKAGTRRRKRARIGFMISRTIIVLLLIAALAEPVTDTERFIDSDPEMTVLIDTSQSMTLLDTASGQELINQLRERLPVTVHEIGTNQSSQLGEETLGRLGPNRNVLLISDGHVTQGATLRDVSRFAASINASVSALRLETIHGDAAVSIEGPQKGIAGMANTYVIRISKTHDKPVMLTITVDGETAFEGSYAQDTYVLERTFSQGEHVIEASIEADDFFEKNNAFARTVDIQEQPPILLITRKSSGVTTIANELYDVTITDRFPESLEGYAAVLLNDVPEALIDTDELARFISEGNGAFVIGGERSYNNGGYRDSVLETLLPVRVGTGTTSQGGANIVVAIDLSGSTGESIVYQKNDDGTLTEVGVSEQVQNLEKALAAGVISDLNPSNSVGVLGYTYPQIKSPSACTGACVIHPLQSLGDDKQAIIDKISRVDITGNTAIWAGLEGALEMLKGSSGSRNVILISDGISGPTDRQQSMAAANQLRQLGGTIYTVQVGDDPAGTQLLQDIAAAGAGIYFKATQSNNLAILFGEPVDIDQGDAFDLVVLNQNHFITQGIETEGVLYAYNEVFPKPGARLLVASSGGNPVLTVWNYGVGRVASITAYDGRDLGALLEEGNSELLTRTTNWAIGDPDRLNAYRLTVPDTREGRTHYANLTTEGQPQTEEVMFERVGRDRYVAELEPKEVGVHEILGKKYAVNYQQEIQRIGMSSTLEEEISIGGGLLFETDEIETIIEHAKTQQQLRAVEERSVGWLFVAAAMLVYLIEVLSRRLIARRRMKRQAIG